MTPKTGDATQRRVMMFTPADLLVYLLQFCGSSGIVLHDPESFQYLAILSEQKTTDAYA